MKTKFGITVLFCFIFGVVTIFKTQAQDAWQHQKYSSEIKPELKKGWGTYNTRNNLSIVKLPECFEISMDFTFQATTWGVYSSEDETEFNVEGWRESTFTPYAHAIDGSYIYYDYQWQDIDVSIKMAHENDELVILITPKKLKHPSTVLFKSGILWNKPGFLQKNGKNIEANFPEKKITVYPVSGEVIDFYAVRSSTPYIPIKLESDKEVAITTGSKKTLAEAKEIIARLEKKFYDKAASYGKDLKPAYEAIITSLGWNTIYDPIYDRVVSTVARSWNKKRGGYAFFGWDNFFMAYLSAIESKELAYANVIEHLHDKTEEGFIPNISQGSGRKSFDRSQPPVGSIMVKEIYKIYQEKWFIEAVFDELYGWNRWWLEKRLHEGMLCWGSHVSKNPFKDKRYNTLKAATLETGLDDSPMYLDVEFNKEKGVMLLHDVGLNGLYVADCRALAEMADIIGRKDEAKILRKTVRDISKQMETLWDEEDGIYYNKKVDSDFHKVLAPTLFYAMMAKVPDEKQAKRMIDEHFYNENEFWGEWIMPSVSRNNPHFEEQKYWNGAIWAPLNFLVYLSFCEYDVPKARKDLSDKSLQLFVKEWERKRFVSENYSAIEGTGDDTRIRSHRFYTWGALLGIIPFIEAGKLPKPNTAIK